MTGSAWRRFLRSSSPPETSTPAGRISASLRPAVSSDSLDSSAARAAAGARHAARRLRLGLLSAVLCLPLLAGLSAPAAAQTPTANPDGSYTVPLDWALKPSGFAGDEFRLLFVTTGRRGAQSSNIADYDTFVQTEAASGHAAIQPYSNQFKMVGSTSSVDARDNTMTTGTGVPIYWLNGDKVADDYNDFWDGSWDAQMASDTRNANGVAEPTALRTWTGTRSNGTSRFPLGIVNINFGQWGSGTNPIDHGQDDSAQMKRLLALSPVFRMPAAVTTVTVSADATVVTEGEAVVFTLTATPALDAALSVPVAVSEKAPGRTGRDFVAWAQEKTHTVSIPASGTATLTIPTVRDGFDEPEGLVTAALRPGGGYAVGDPSSASVAVADDDGPPPPTAEMSIVGGSPLPEGAAISFTLALSRSLAADETVTLPLAIGGTATRGGTDYRLTCAAGAAFTCNGLDGAGPSITFHGAVLDGRHRVSSKMWLEAIEDGTVESNETVTLQLGGGRTTTITLKDAPSSVTLSFFQGGFSGPEGGGLFQPVLRVDAAPGADIPVTLVYTDTTDTTDLTATAGADYVKEATVTYSADGRTRSSIDIPTLEDALCEGDETFRVAIDASSLPSWVTLGSHGSAVMTLKDDDCTATVSGVSDAKEGASAQFAVHVTPAPVRDMDIGYAVSEDAGNSRQFVAAGNKGGGRTVTVRANQPSVEVTVPTVQAAGADADGRVTVTLESGNQYTLGSPSSTSVRVFDDQYEADHVTFTGVAGSAKGPLYNSSAFGSGTFEVNEGVGAIWVELELSQTPKSQTTVYVRERGSGTTATRGADYQRPPYGWTANFGAGRKGRARFKVLIVDDGIDDDRETLTLDIYEVSNVHGDFRPDTAGHGANTGPLGTYEITIRDYTSSASGDDVWVWLSADVYEVAEGGTLEAAVHLEEARGVDTVISVTETRGTARSGTDYTAGPYSVTVPAGGTMGTFTIQTAEDTELEMDETFRIRIDDASLPAGFGTPDEVGMPEEARVTINDDEYTFCFDQGSYSIREGEELAANIQFSRPLPEGGWFKFTYSDRNATSGEDYTRVNAFPDRFWLPAGTEEHTLRIPFAEDTLYEGNELFHVQADVPALPDGHAECSMDAIIRDNSREVDFVVAAYTAHEGRAAEVAVRVVERNSDNPLKLRKPVTLHVADSGTGTATSGTDYAAGPWTLTIPAGASRGVLRIPVHADSASDDGETIDLAIRRAGTGTSENDRQLLGADGAVSSDNLHVRVRDVTDMANGAATVTIGNASEAQLWKPVVSIEAGPQVSEGNDATFTLKASPPPLAPLDVSVHVGETDVSHDLTDPFSGIRRHLAEGDLGLRVATVDTTGSTVFAVPTRTNGAANTGAVRVALMDPALVFGDGEADYSVGRPDVAYVGVDTAAPEFEAQRSEESAVAVAPTEPVRNLRVTAVDAASAQASWDAVPHATAYRLEWEGGSGGDYIGGGSNGVTDTTGTIYHNAPAAMTLTVRVTPWHVADDGEVREHDALAATATLAVGPEDPLAAAARECRGNLESDIQGYIGEQADGTPHVTRWKRVLAAFGVDNGYTKMTSAEAQTHADRGWTRWDPVVTALQCLEAAAADGDGPVQADPVISVAGGGDVTEGTLASFTVTADPAPSAPLTVMLAIAQSGDFAASGETGTREVVVPAGGSVTIDVATVDDAADEPDGSVSATVNAGAGYTVAAPPGDAASVAVADDDPAPAVPEFTIGDATAAEADRFMWFTVSLSMAPESPVGVSWRTRESTPASARSGDDFLRTDFGSIEFAPGETVQRLWVYLLDDGLDEDAETFEVVLSNPTGGAGIADGVAVGTIGDSGGTPPAAAREDDGTPPPATPGACVSVSQWDTVKGYYDANANRSPNYGANWYRVLIAYQQDRADQALPGWVGQTAEPTAAYTAEEAADGESRWSGWTPVREALECLERTYGGTSTSSAIGGVPTTGRSREVGTGNSGGAVERKRRNPATAPGGFEPDAMTDFAAGSCVSPQLRSEATARARETWRGPAHVERWLRVARTFSGGANDATVVTPAEAGFHAATGQPGWLPVADALRCMEQQSLREALSR